MKPGLALGAALFLAASVSASAQNLGLGTGSRPPAEDTAAQAIKPDRQEEPPAPRKTQFNKRLGLTARRNGTFDTKAFEIRGRELSGQFYEIGTPPGLKANEKRAPAAPAAQQKIDSGQWLWWVGAAGIAGVSAGVAGLMLMSNSHPTSKPPDVPLVLSDDP